MSAGITPRDFVQQVFYQQEKVLLDFYPTDDKYREVLMDGNYVLQELQKEEDWLWLRDTMSLGMTKDNWQSRKPQTFKIDTESVYKLSGLFGDCVHLCGFLPDTPEDIVNFFTVPNDPSHSAPGVLYKTYDNAGNIVYVVMPGIFDRPGFTRVDTVKEVLEYYADISTSINVPLISTGTHHSIIKNEVSQFGKPNWGTVPLGCYVLDDKLCFNRPFLPFESNRIVMVDYQKRIDQFHICDYRCPDSDEHIEEFADTPMLQCIPDINYIVMRTAATHAMGSPTAQGNIATLTDTAQKLLSAMRENNAMATTCDTMEWYTPGFIEVV